MKRIFRLTALAVFFMTAVVLTGCDSNNDPDNPSGGGNDKPDVPVYSVESVRTYTRAEFIDRALGGYGALMGDDNLEMVKSVLGYAAADDAVYTEAVINYQSVDHRGMPIELSGLVSFKVNAAKAAPVKQIIVDNHATITDNASCPSIAGTASELLMLNSATAVIAADYQGYGVSRLAIHPYLNESLTARQQADLVRCAVDYMLQQSLLTDDMTTYSVGYSQGGAVALALHRLLETEESQFAKTIGFAGSVCGDGPYSPVNTMHAYIEQGYVSIPVILPMIVRSMIECYPELFDGLTLADYFTPEFLNAGGGIMNLIDSKQLNTIEFNALLGAGNPLASQFPLSSILNAEAMTEGSDQMDALLAALGRNNCILGWTPKARVCFYHSKDDTVVPYCNLDDLDAWPESAYTITGPTQPGLDHMGAAVMYYMDLVMRGPAGMLK